MHLRRTPEVVDLGSSVSMVVPGYELGGRPASDPSLRLQPQTPASDSNSDPSLSPQRESSASVSLRTTSIVDLEA